MVKNEKANTEERREAEKSTPLYHRAILYQKKMCVIKNQPKEEKMKGCEMTI